MLKAADIDNQILTKLKLKNFIIIDDYDNNIDEKLFYSILNQSFQINQYIIISSNKPIKKLKSLLYPN